MSTTQQQLAAIDQDVASLVTALYDPSDPDWTAALLDYVVTHLDDETLPITLKAGLEYNTALLEAANERLH